MNANTVIASCATVIAVASLGVSVYAVWATRKHNRLSVQPLLGLATRFRVGDTAGLLLSNFGLGPAKVTNTELTLDDDRIGDFSKPYVDKLRSRLSVRPHATTLGGHPFLDTDYEQFLLSVDSYDPSQHREFRELIEGHLKIEIQYESIYGGKEFTVVYPRDRLSHSRLGSAETSAWEVVNDRPLTRSLRRCVVIISLGAAPCRDESRDRASANRSPESFINGLVFTLKRLTLAR